MTALTPGAYLALRRRAAGLSIDDLAAAIGTEPHTDERARRHWIAAIEADLQLPPPGVAVLRRFFAFDPDALAALVAGEPVTPLCVRCGCSLHDGCADADGVTCDWIAPDRCSACVPDEPARRAAGVQRP